MKTKELKNRMENITTPQQAVELAVEWQMSFNDEQKYWSEIAEENALFAALAAKFDLTEEFEENGIL